MAARPYSLTFSYDELLFLAITLEHFASESGAALRTIPDEPGTRDGRARLEQQIAQADALLGRVNEARR